MTDGQQQITFLYAENAENEFCITLTKKKLRLSHYHKEIAVRE